MSNPIVPTSLGPVSGVSDENLIHFWGIPYAQPPVGPLRFRPPVKPTPWQSPYPATQQTPAAPQQFTPRPNQNRSAFSMPQSEDCLYLNVTTASLTGCRPVVVTVHGGGNISGTCNENIYEPSQLVLRSGVVHVGIEFRIGIFAFLYHPNINTNNLNALDILAALDWVRENIAHFGGNPDNITVMGFSSGANDIGSLFLQDRPLPFHKAMLCSGSLGRCNFTAAQATQISTGILKRLGIHPDDPHVLSKLQALPATLLIDAAYQYARTDIAPSEWGFLWRPVDDESAALPNKAAWEAGRAAKQRISLLIGYASDEQRLIYPDDDAASQEETNRLYIAPARAYAQAASQMGGSVWLYEFAWYPAGSPFGACHGIQLPFLYRNRLDSPLHFRFLSQMPDQTMKDLSALFGQNTTRFYREGIPAPQAEWAPYRPGHPVYRLFDGAQNKCRTCAGESE